MMKAYLNLRSLELLQRMTVQRTEAEQKEGHHPGGMTRDDMVVLAREIYQQVVDNK